MSRNSLDALFGMMNSAFLDKEHQEYEKVSKALEGVDSIEKMPGRNILRLKRYTDFGVEYEIPMNWELAEREEHKSVMYVDNVYEGTKEFTAAALRIRRLRGDYRGYENLDQLRKLALYVAKKSKTMDFKYLDEILIGRRKGIKVSCEDYSDPNDFYDIDMYFFYKSKTEIMIFFCITAQRTRSYYGKIFNKILSSIRYLR